MLLVALRDLQQRARQFAVAVVGAALVFAMALIMTGLGGGFRAEVRNTVASVGADAFIVRAGEGGPFTGYAGIPEQAVSVIAAEAGVRRADPFLVSLQPLDTAHGKDVNVHLIGYRVGGLGMPRVAKGRDAVRLGEVTVDVRSGLHLGQQVRLAGQRITVVGITHGLSYDAGLANAYVTLQQAQRAAYGGSQIITAVAITGTPVRVPPGLALVSASAARKDMLSKLQDAIAAIDNTTYFLWVVAGVIVAIVTYLSALERLRDFAVLKAVGASTSQLYAGLAMQSVLVSVLACLVAVGLERFLTPLLPLPISVRPSAFEALPLVAIVMGLLASLGGVRQAVRADPALAFGA